jgi:membrane protein YdbS with pleckstrin-like domain
MSWRDGLLRFLRVPSAPSVPAGDMDVEVFRAAPNYLGYRVLRWALSNTWALCGVIFGLTFMDRIPTGGITSVEMLLFGVEGLAIAGFLIQAVVRFALLKIDIDQRWYLVSDRSLRIREGIIHLKEKTMTFANIQNVRIEQGPLQRLFGIADLHVRTAGGGSKLESDDLEQQGGGKDMHFGYFRGVSNAEAIRDTIRERLPRHADAGLGDPDDVATHEAHSILDAAHELAHEAATLRRSVGLLASGT